MTTKKQPKPIFLSTLYRVIKRSAGVYAVETLSGVTQFTGTKQFAVDWAMINSGMGVE